MELSIKELFPWEKLPVTYSQYRVLETIFKMKRCLLTQLSRELNYAVSTCTETVARLVHKKLVKKRIDLEDKRKTWVILTEKGKRLVEDIIAEKDRLMQEFRARLSRKEQELFINIQKKLQEIKAELRQSGEKFKIVR